MPEDMGMFRDKDRPGFFTVEGTRDDTVSKPNVFNEMVNNPEVWNEKWINWS